MTSTVSSASYENYTGIKGWDPVIKDEERAYADEMFEKETRGVAVAPGMRVLEIGFGRGLFLDWASRRGAAVVGVEIIPEVCDWARERFEVYCGELPELASSALADQRFDLIAMWDVVEHLSQTQAEDYLRACHALTVPGARMVLRFPNGMSPLSAVYQHGDPTHRALYSPAMVAALARPWFETRAVRNAARVYGPRRRLHIAKATAFGARTLVEALVGYVYYGQRVLLDPNVTIVLDRQ